jgi:hypothetical protein
VAKKSVAPSEVSEQNVINTGFRKYSAAIAGLAFIDPFVSPAC